MSSAYFAPLVTKPVIIDAPGQYVTRTGEVVTVESVSPSYHHNFGCTGYYNKSTINERWHKSGRISAMSETANDIIGKVEADDD